MADNPAAQIDPPPRAAAIIVQDGAVALIERFKGDETYCLFPGGKVEDGESITEAVVREVQEELGVEVAVGRLLAEVTYAGRTQFYFLAEALSGDFGSGQGAEMTGRTPAEHGTYRPVWLPIAKLRETSVYPAGVAELVMSSMTEGWPQEAVKFLDPGRARRGRVRAA